MRASSKPCDALIRSSVPGMYRFSRSWKCATRAITWWLSVGWPTFVFSSRHCACSWSRTSSSIAFHTAYVAAWAAKKIGRASCREREYVLHGDVQLGEKTVRDLRSVVVGQLHLADRD